MIFTARLATTLAVICLILAFIEPTGIRVGLTFLFLLIGLGASIMEVCGNAG